LGNTVTTIDASTLRNAPVTNLSEQLAARDPSVSVLPSGGLTGEGAQIRIRATASLTQANEPVVYVDGVRVNRGGGFGDPNWIGAARQVSLGIHVPTAAELSAFYGRSVQPFDILEQRFVDRLFETGYGGTYSASVSGGTPGVTYYVNGRYYRENGPFGGRDLGPAADFDRKAQGSASLVMLPSDNLKVTVNSGYPDAHHETPNNN